MSLAFVSQLHARWYKIFVRLYVETSMVEIKILIFEYQETLIKLKVLEKWFFGIAGLLGSKIMRPTENEADFVNRKGNHSINVQCVKDDFQGFIDVEARWPESSHDSFLFNHCGGNYLYQDNFTLTDKELL